MGENRPTSRAVVRYTLLQLPSLFAVVVFLFFLQKWTEISGNLIWSLTGAWVLKDIILFHFLWRFYDPNQYRDWFDMVGRKGIAMSQLNPKGYVRIRGERWQAKAAENESPILKGQSICVQEINGLRLIVNSNSKDRYCEDS